MPKVTGAGGVVINRGRTSPQGNHDVRSADRRPDVAALPQGKVDRIIVFQATVLKCSQGGDLNGLEQPTRCEICRREGCAAYIGAAKVARPL